MTYFVQIEGKKQGPYDIGELAEMLLHFKITKDTLCCPESGAMESWTPVGEIPGLVDEITSKASTNRPRATSLVQHNVSTERSSLAGNESHMTSRSGWAKVFHVLGVLSLGIERNWGPYRPWISAPSVGLWHRRRSPSLLLCVPH